MSKTTAYFDLETNSLSSAIPTELGALTELESDFYLTFNSLCGRVPTEVQALSSSGVTGWSITEGNYIDSDCKPGRRAFFVSMMSILILSISGKRI